MTVETRTRGGKDKGSRVLFKRDCSSQAVGGGFAGTQQGSSEAAVGPPSSLSLVLLSPVGAVYLG